MTAAEYAISHKQGKGIMEAEGLSGQLRSCSNCGNTFSGNYCNNCGQEYFDHEDKSFAHLAGEVLHFITHLEGSFWLTLKTVLASPGSLAKDYCAGARKRYFIPISFFLLIVVLYLVFPIFQGLNMEVQSGNTSKQVVMRPR